MQLEQVGLQFGSTLCSGRFQIQRALGAGGMGSVYAAWDHELGRWVALKTLNRVDAEGLYRIKQEFRAFAELRHPGLLELYELFEERGRLFFTMALIDGDNLFDALQAAPKSALDEPYEEDLRGTPQLAAELDVARARRFFQQVAEALSFLHAAGRIHRDIKPQNILVDRRGGHERAVLLDFGVGAVRGIDGALETSADSLMGTPAYMAPEMLHTGGDESSDWYAFGVMLYEVLTGELPFEENELTKLGAEKRATSPIPPHLRVHNAPRDLSQLAMDLLAPDADERARGDEVLRRLHSAAPAEPQSSIRTALAKHWVGRATELERLRSALDQVSDEQPKVVLLHGPSGMGKSTLARHFLRARTSEGSTWLLSGACYEQESLRFKVFDGAVDVLSRQLLSLPEGEVAGHLPRRVAALTAMFPVLARVPALGSNRRPARFELPADASELRSHAFEALRDLLASIALSHRLILFVDDLQWGDVDSVALLRALVADTRAPGMLVLFTYRSDDVAESPCLQAIMQLRADMPELFVDVPLAPLSITEAIALARQLEASLDAEQVAQLSTSAQGNPLVLSELIEQSRQRDRMPEHAADSPLDLAGMLDRRLAQLSADARELLELLSIAGQPLPRATYAAARRGDSDLHVCIAELRRARLIRAGSSRGVLSPYHDSVRESVVRTLSAEERARLHTSLARVLQAQADPDLDALAHHWLNAGDHARAVRYAERAAERALRHLAFARAAALYRLAFEHVADRERRNDLRKAWAEALVLDGRRADAAEVYLAGLHELSDAEAANARQRAGQQLLLSGHVARGLPLLRDALAGIRAPLESDIGPALTAWAEQHNRLVARGLSYKPRSVEQLSSATAMRLDTLWAAGFGLNRYAGVRVYGVLAQHVYEALERGDTVRVVRGLCMYHAIADYPTHLLGGALLGARAAAERIAEHSSDPICAAWLLIASGFEGWFNGSPRALESFKEAAKILHERCAGAAAELGFTHQVIVGQYMAAGAWDLANEHCHRFGAEAAQRNDRLYDYIFEQRTIFSALMAGDRQAATRALERVAETARDRQEETTFPVRFAQGHVAAATGDVAGLERALAWTRAFAKKPEARLPNFRTFVKLNEGRLSAALALQAAGQVREELLRQADVALEAASALGLETLGASVMFARAGVALAQGRRALALTFLEATIARAPHYSGMLSDLARYHLARLSGDEQQREASAQSLVARGVLDIALITTPLSPFLSQDG